MSAKSPFDEARELLHAQLAKSPHQGVRALNDMVTLSLPDNDGRIAWIAAAIIEQRNTITNPSDAGQSQNKDAKQ